MNESAISSAVAPSKRTAPASRRRVNFWVDTALFALFLAVVILGFNSHGHRHGGMSAQVGARQVHEWLGISVLGAVVIHLVLHWDWIKRKSKYFFKKMRAKARFDYILDAISAVVFSLIMLSGVMISGTFTDGPHRGSLWTHMHHATTQLAIIVFAVHIVRHWSWIRNCFSVKKRDECDRDG